MPACCTVSSGYSSLAPTQPTSGLVHRPAISRIEPGITCRGSEAHLRRVAEILLDNARTYADPGTVEFSLERQGKNRALLRVVSPGEPLPPEECRNIFRRFYRLDRTRSSDGSYGLGLAIAESIVRDHQGKIWCEGAARSNVFFVQLPCASPK